MTIGADDMEGVVGQSSSPTDSPSSPVVAPQEASKPDGGAPTSRLIIREMVLENFKSYAGAQRVGPFHKVW